MYSIDLIECLCEFQFHWFFLVNLMSLVVVTMQLSSIVMKWSCHIYTNCSFRQNSMACTIVTHRPNLFCLLDFQHVNTKRNCWRKHQIGIHQTRDSERNKFSQVLKGKIFANSALTFIVALSRLIAPRHP